MAAGDARFAYGDFGLTHAVGGDGSTVDYTYDSAGNLVTVNSARFAYDAHGRVTRAEVDGSTTEYQYGDGQPILRVTDGQTTQYTYDGRRRLVRSGTVAYSYDTDGSLLAVSDAGGITRFTYDRSGRLTAIIEPDGVATAFAYNAAGLLSQVVPDVGDEVLVDFQQGTPGTPYVIGALYTGDRGDTFSLNLRGRLSTCGTCP